MSTENMKENDTVVQKNNTQDELLVLPLQEAEKWARQITTDWGDYNDLRTVFWFIRDASENFLKDPKLHNDSAIIKHCGLNPETTKEWLLELSGFGTMNKKPLIAALPCLYLTGGYGKPSELTCFPVYVRPQARESSNLENYKDKLNENNLRVLTQWNAERYSKPKQEMSDMLIQCANEGKTISFLIQKQITEIFARYMEGTNVTSDKQRFVYHNFVRPILQTLIQQEVLSFHQVSLQGKVLQALY